MALPALLAALATSAVAADAKDGRRIYRNGLATAGLPVEAQVGQVRLEGQTVACARCHGADGRGGREGGVVTPPLRWSALTSARAGGDGLAPRPAYDERALVEAIRAGVDAAGRPLSSAMPRFTLSPREMADLVAHLRRLGTDEDRDPGVLPDRLVLGTALPLSGPAAATGEAARAAVEACVARANRDGGIFDRRIELLALDAAALPARDIASRLADETLAVVAPWLPDVDAARLAALLPDVPVVGPLGAAAELPAGASSRAPVFTLTPQLADQARVLVDAIAERFATGPRADGSVVIGVMAAGSAQDGIALRAAREQANAHPSLRWVELPAASALPEPAALVRWVEDTKPKALLVLGSADWIVAAAQLAASRPAPLPVYASALELGLKAFGLDAASAAVLQLTHSQPLGDDASPVQFFQDLEGIGRKPQAPALQANAWASTCVAVEGLRRAGRQANRESLVTALESISRWRTGVTEPVSFGPRQRVGVWGARLVAVDVAGRRYRPLGAWRAPNVPGAAPGVGGTPAPRTLPATSGT